MPVTAVRCLEEARERDLNDLARRALELWQRLVVERTREERREWEGKMLDGEQ